MRSQITSLECVLPIMAHSSVKAENTMYKHTDSSKSCIVWTSRCSCLESRWTEAAHFILKIWLLFVKMQLVQHDMKSVGGLTHLYFCACVNMGLQSTFQTVTFKGDVTSIKRNYKRSTFLFFLISLSLPCQAESFTFRRKKNSSTKPPEMCLDYQNKHQNRRF